MTNDDLQHDGQQQSDHTLDADPATLDTIRRLATQAREQASPPSNDPADHTVDADDATLDQIRRLAEQASRRPAWGAPDTQTQATRTPLSELPLADVNVTPLLEPTRLPERPPSSHEPWRPPPRSVRLEPEPRTTDLATHKWRLATVALAVLVVILLGWMLLGGDSDPTESPTDTSIVNSSVTTGSDSGSSVPAGTPVTGSIGEGGAGG